MLRVGLVADAVVELAERRVAEVATVRVLVDFADLQGQRVEVALGLVPAVALLAEVALGPAVAVRLDQYAHD